LQDRVNWCFTASVGVHRVRADSTRIVVGVRLVPGGAREHVGVTADMTRLAKRWRPACPVRDVQRHAAPRRAGEAALEVLKTGQV
jgi:hypothetical protein